MSNYYERLDFKITDYTGNTSSLSSYCLPGLTPLTFEIRAVGALDKNLKIVWDLGDGTKKEGNVIVHSYERPGKYRVFANIFDCLNIGKKTLISREIVIKDFLIDTFNVKVQGNSLVNLPSGNISPQILIDQTIPWYEKDNTIEFISKSNTKTYFSFPEKKFIHLIPHNSLLTPYTYRTTPELVEVETISTPLSPIYIQKNGSSLVTSLSPISNIIAGFSGKQIFYYRDDRPTNTFSLTFKRANNTSNTISTVITGTIIEDAAADHFSITSTGYDGDAFPINSFNIVKNKFNGVEIPFVIKVKDANKNTLKVFNQSYHNSLSVVPINISHKKYIVKNISSTLSNISGMHAYRGTIVFYDVISPLLNVQLSARAPTSSLTSVCGSVVTKAITGVSTSFNVYPKNFYSIVKQNEDFNMESAFRSLARTETLLDKEIFYQKIIGTIFGNEKIDHTALGTSAYEKITNFIDNTTNIDRAGVNFLLSITNMLDLSLKIHDTNLLISPPNIKRLVDLFSLNKNILLGTTNKFVDNFSDRGEPGTGIYGINLGDEINIYNDIISPFSEDYIVAYEKFSGQYTRLNVYLPKINDPTFTGGGDALVSQAGDENISTEDSQEISVDGSYYLYQYNTSWGWPLVLPQNFTAADLTKYYTFYRFKSIPANNVVGSSINFDKSQNITTNITSKQLIETDGIFENILLDTLYLSLSLTK